MIMFPFPCIIAKGETISYMYEVPIESIKWVKIPIQDGIEVNAFHQGSQIHYKTQSELLKKQQKIETFFKETQERVKRIKHLKKQQLKKKKTKKVMSRRLH